MENHNDLRPIVEPLLAWYRNNARILPWRQNRDPYRIWISEIMLQQTRVDTVIPYYERFLSVLPTVEHLAAVSEDELLKLWEGLGYYSRARNLQKAAQKIVSAFGGVFPQDPKDVATLPGIGPYTTGAICSIAFEQATPAVDGNVLRVISRICQSDDNIDEPAVRKRMTARLAEVYPAEGRGDFTQSLMELGAIVCLPNGAPLCDRCPLNALCRAHLDGRELDYPVKNEKVGRKIVPLTVFLIECDRKIAVCKRAQKGLLAGLWQLPNTDGRLTEEEAQSFLAGQGLTVQSIRKIPSKKHIFTHVEWQMSAFAVTVNNPADGYVWADKDRLENEIPLPTAFRKFF